MKELLSYCSAKLFPKMDCQSNWPSHQVWKGPSFSSWSKDHSIDQWSTHLIVTPSINSLINKVSKGIFFVRPILWSFTDGYMFVELVTSGRPSDRPFGQSSAGRPNDRRNDRSAAWPTNLLTDRHTLAVGSGRKFVLKIDRPTNRRHRFYACIYLSTQSFKLANINLNSNCNHQTQFWNLVVWWLDNLNGIHAWNQFHECMLLDMQ